MEPKATRATLGLGLKGLFLHQNPLPSEPAAIRTRRHQNLLQYHQITEQLLSSGCEAPERPPD